MKLTVRSILSWMLLQIQSVCYRIFQLLQHAWFITRCLIYFCV